MISVTDIKTMNAAEFVAAFGDIAEHSPWVAELAFGNLAKTPLHQAFSDAVLNASETQQLALLRAHPDLATRAKLTNDSTLEQQGAGLDTLSKEEFAHFTALNSQYKKQNGFPFILAVKGATKQQILASFEQRINNPRAAEFEFALQQVCKIISFRLDARVSL